MALAAGTRLGPYEIVAALGAGGMGEVYQARDTRLDRTVAIKVLPAELSSDPERRARFEREARTIAALNHPHICTLHDVGEAEFASSESQGPSPLRVTYLVMEHLAGETLAQRLTKGALPVPQALEIGAQIADALDAAHRHGIVHRDLKPSNLMLTRSGAKLLDFGLAKLRPGGAIRLVPDSSAAATQAGDVTVAGTLVGTIPYMAPEQVEGREADARTDLWALGCLLYEMVTGQRAFPGETPGSLIGAILAKEPEPLAARQPLTTPALQRIVTRCIAKQPDDRWDTAHDVADELRWISEGLTQTAPLTAGRGRWRQARAFLVATTAVTGVALVAASLWLIRSRQASEAPVYLVLTEQRQAQPADPQRSVAVSRDGRSVVYTAESHSVRHLYLRRMESLESTMVPGTAGATAPFFSPDGNRVGFFADGQLKVISIGGGAPVILASATEPRGATWARDDTIIFTPEPDAGLWQVRAGGGAVTLLAQPEVEKRERCYRWPEILPDDDTLLFTLAMSDILSFDDGRLMARSRRTGEQRELLRGGSFPAYAETGHLLYARAGAVLAVPFDATRRVVTGVPDTVMSGVVTHPANGSAQYAVSRTGTLVFVPGGSTIRAASLTWVDKSGKADPLDVPAAAYQSVRVSPDGRSAALQIDDANASIWILELERSAMTRLTLEWNNGPPEWSPDGSRVAFGSTRAGSPGLFSQAVDGRTGPEALGSAPGWGDSASWSPNGRVLAYARLGPETGWDIWTLAVGEGRQQRPFLISSFNERQPRFSPTGHWIAYVSDETGRPEVYVQPFPGPGRKSRVSTDGGTTPVWARDGRELFYWGSNGSSMMSVTMSPWPGLSTGRPRSLFNVQSSYPFDVAPDGRFLIIQDQPEGGPVSPVAVVLNWFEELKAKVPRGRR